MVDRGGCGVLIYVLHMIAVEQLPLDIHANILCQLPAEMYVVGNSKIRIGGGLRVAVKLAARPMKFGQAPQRIL